MKHERKETHDRKVKSTRVRASDKNPNIIESTKTTAKWTRTHRSRIRAETRVITRNLNFHRAGMCLERDARVHTRLSARMRSSVVSDVPHTPSAQNACVAFDWCPTMRVCAIMVAITFDMETNAFNLNSNIMKFN